MATSLDRVKPPGFWQGIQGRLVLLILMMFASTLLIQAYVFTERYRTHRSEQLQANLEIARAVAEMFKGFVQDVLRQELGIGIAFTLPQSLTVEQMSAILSEINREYPMVRNFAWATPQGRSIASNLPGAVGLDIAMRDYYREIIAGKDHVLSDLYPSQVDGKPCFSISRGIRDASGNLLGIVIAIVDPDKLDKEVAVKRAIGGGMALVDKRGMLVYRYPKISVTWEERNWLEQYPQLADALEGKEAADTVYASYEGKKRLVGFTPVPSLGWAATAGRTEEVAMAAVMSSLLPQTISFLAATIAVFGIALALSRRISAPVAQVRDQALGLGRGEALVPVIPSGPTEIKELADSFNLMALELRKAHDELELRVRERTAELVRASEDLQRQAALLNLAHDAILVRGLDHTVTFWNDGATEVYGFTRGEALGKITHELLRTRFPEPLEDIIEKVISEGTWEGELKQTTCVGEEITVESRWALQPGRDGAPLGLLEINRDVTARKLAEEALRSNMARLELVNAELQEFAFVAAHDLQEPLRKIQTFCDLLKTRCAPALDDAGQGYLERVLTSAGRMRQLLDELLQFSRVAKRAEPFKRVDLTKVVREAASVFEGKLEEAGGVVEIGNIPSIEADESQMLRLFQNLIGNALKYRSGEKPRIIVYASQDGEGCCEIYVKDNGIGFDQQYAELIFKPFQRLHDRGVYEGTGMGLAICRKIAERHGGSIRVESEPGKGSTFTIKLPVKQHRLGDHGDRKGSV